jgi:hypothetical protein
MKRGTVVELTDSLAPSLQHEPARLGRQSQQEVDGRGEWPRGLEEVSAPEMRSVVRQEAARSASHSAASRETPRPVRRRGKRERLRNRRRVRRGFVSPGTRSFSRRAHRTCRPAVRPPHPAA